MAGFHAGGREDLDLALACFRKAIALDPGYASAYAMAAWCLFTLGLNGWMDDRPQEASEAPVLARRAVDLGRGDAVALARGGHALAHLNCDLDAGVDFLDRALALDPNLATAWFLSGYLRLFRGEPDEAIRRFEHAMRLSPLDSELFRMKTGIGLAHLIAGRFDEATAWAAKGVRDAPALVLPGAVLAASHALGGRIDKAEVALRQARAFNPAMRLAGLNVWLPFRRPEDANLFADGLRKAGLPE